MSYSCADSPALRRKRLRRRSLSMLEVSRVIAGLRKLFVAVFSLRWENEAEDVFSSATEIVLRNCIAGDATLSSEAQVAKALLEACLQVIREIDERHRLGADALDHAVPFSSEEDTDSDED